MKKVLSIAVSSILLSNLSFAQTDNNVLKNTQPQVETNRSGLGSDVQGNNGLGSSNAPLSIKDSTTMERKVQTETTKLTSTEIVPVEVKKIGKSEKNMENCEPVHKPVKKVKKYVAKKKVVKPIIVKKSISVSNNYEMRKTQNYVPTDFTNKQKWISSSDVQLSILNKPNQLDISISDTNGQVIPKEQFKNSNLRIVQFSSDLKITNNQTKEMNFQGLPYSFDKKVETCGTVFVQYQLKNAPMPTSLVKHIDSNGLLQDNLDSTCEKNAPKDLPTNLNYSVNNNISGLFFKNHKLLSSRPVAFNIVFSKDGVTRNATDLFVYAVKPDFSDLVVFEPKSYGTAASGTYFENNLNKGDYILGYSFKEGKFESYLKNIQVQ